MFQPMGTNLELDSLLSSSTVTYSTIVSRNSQIPTGLGLHYSPLQKMVSKLMLTGPLWALVFVFALRCPNVTAAAVHHHVSDTWTLVTICDKH
jgi:hypothetical protein